MKMSKCAIQPPYPELRGSMAGIKYPAMAEIKKDVKELLALANKSKGGLWAGMAIVSAISSFVGFIIHYFTSK